MYSIEKYCIIRELEQDCEQWIKYLKSYDIDVIPNGKLMIIRFDCKKHILFSDLSLILKYGRVKYQWQQSYESDLSKKVLQFRQQIKLWNIHFNFDQMPLDNFVFFFDQNDVNIISIFPKKLKYMQNSSEIENLTTQVNQFSQKIMKDQKSPVPQQNIDFKEFIKNVVKFNSESLIDAGQPLDEKIQTVLKRRIQMKSVLTRGYRWYSGYYDEEYIDQIVNYIKQVDDETKAEYLEQYVVEQPYETLGLQVKYLQNLSQQSQITNQMRINLIEQGNVANQLVHFEQILKKTVQATKEVFDSHQYQKLSDVTLSNMNSSFMAKFQHCDLKCKLSNSSDQKMAECVNIFIQELFTQYWFLDGISEIEQFKQIPNDLKQLIKKLLLNYEEKLRQISNNNDDVKFLIGQIVYSLQILDQFDILEKFVQFRFNQIKDAIKIIIQEKKLFSDFKIVVEVIGQNNLDYNLRDKQKLKENSEVQNDILLKMVNQLRTIIQACFEKHKLNTTSEKIEQVLEDILQQLFKGKLQNQLQILHEDFLNQLCNHYRKHEDYQLLKDSIKPQDFKPLTNLFCKSETIILTSNYQNLVNRLKIAQRQYQNFSLQLKYLLGQLDQMPQQEKIKRDILTSHFKEYVISDKLLFLDLQFQSIRVFNLIQKELIEELKNKIYKQIESRDKFILEMRECLKEQYIPFKSLEIHLQKCLDSEKNKISVEIYKQISKVLRGSEESDIQQITQFKPIKQEKLQQWETIKLNTLNALNNSEPQQWNEQQLNAALQSARKQHFQEEIEKAQLCKTLTGFAFEKLKTENNKFDTTLSDPIKIPEELLDQLYKCVDQQIKLQQTQQK